MNILFIVSDQLQEWNCSWWRCILPHLSLSKSGFHSDVLSLVEWSSRSTNTVRITEAADIVIIQRNLFANVLAEVLYWKAKGKVIVADVDDAYAYMTKETGSPSYDFWINHKKLGADGKTEIPVEPHPLDQLKAGIKLCGVITSPSKLLCLDWAAYAKTYWFPNYIDPTLYTQHPVFHNPNRLFIGWGGSMTHLVSWEKSGASEGLNQICKEYPQVSVMLIGDPRVARYVKVPPARRFIRGWENQAVFSESMSYFDIGVIPLFGEYDRRRSWIKSLEFTTMGIPWVGSNMEPNQDIPTGTLVKNSPEAWYLALKNVIDNLESYRRAAQDNLALVDQYSIQANAGNIYALLERIKEEYVSL
jgi:hypothetical protein